MAQIFRRYAEQVLSVRAHGEAKPSGVTPNHPFYVRVHRARDNTRADDNDGKWREAGRLRVGDKVKLAAGGWAQVLGIERRGGGAAVYNFETADNHNYFVGQTGLLVHNQCATIPKVANPKLANIVRDLFKGALGKNPIGTGSTADAVRNELVTGLQTGGTFHSDKASQYINALTNWLRRNPNANHYDRMVAQSLLDDLKGALAGK